MIKSATIATCIAVILACPGCSTKPRNFSVTVAPAASGQASAQTESEAFSACNAMVRSGLKGNFASALATGAATSAGVYGGAGLATAGIAGSSLSAAGATAMAAVPLVGFAAAFGMNRMIRSGRERKYKRTMTECMQQLGYDVVAWNRVPRKQPATATLRSEPDAPMVGTGEETTPAPTASSATPPPVR